ncbi:hypothetical protein BJP40_06740 [Streptomyces sp. CC53]|uniref:hypothetical protein n=1 Tax=Streptomyces sp. CC53 TaxID=1906740 RepID=UPI0008DDA14A|nr:hypothetical protein [Streptomyces sp. CC53]OII61218.1 hypothetical protein BJP40_06740 [Streptomyces sp. CC53]
MHLITGRARARMYWGNWIADCPGNCGCALRLKPAQASFPCPECKLISEVEWPSNADEIYQVLLKRPAPRNRNWFPAGHELALRAGCPHGQSVADLEAETAEHMEG